jgi:hypothetical protein
VPVTKLSLVLASGCVGLACLFAVSGVVWAIVWSRHRRRTSAGSDGPGTDRPGTDGPGTDGHPEG